jgi:signal transduction histidine kinase
VTAKRGPPAEPTWKQLDDILAILSHDLRSPLSAISVAIDALADPALDAPVRDRYLAAMRRSVTRAELFLSELLDVSQISAGNFTVESKLISVEPLVEQAAREHEARAKELGNWFVIESDDGTHRVSGDAGRLQQALDKLIANSLRHARGTGAITLRVENAQASDPGVGKRDTVRLWVIDRGTGIAEEEIEEIFDRWRHRGDVRRNGPGLGLPLARGIAEAHGGSIHVESKPGEGARVCLELPAASPS